MLMSTVGTLPVTASASPLMSIGSRSSGETLSHLIELWSILLTVANSGKKPPARIPGRRRDALAVEVLRLGDGAFCQCFNRKRGLVVDHENGDQRVDRGSRPMKRTIE